MEGEAVRVAAGPDAQRTGAAMGDLFHAALTLTGAMAAGDDEPAAMADAFDRLASLCTLLAGSARHGRPAP